MTTPNPQPQQFNVLDGLSTSWGTSVSNPGTVSPAVTSLPVVQSMPSSVHTPQSFNFSQSVIPHQNFTLPQQQFSVLPPSVTSPFTAGLQSMIPQAATDFMQQSQVMAPPPAETPTVASEMRESLGLNLVDDLGLGDNTFAKLLEGPRLAEALPNWDTASVGDGRPDVGGGSGPLPGPLSAEEGDAPRTESLFTEGFGEPSEGALEFSSLSMPGYEAAKRNYSKVGEDNTDPKALSIRSTFESTYTGVEESMPPVVSRLQRLADVDTIPLDDGGKVTPDAVRQLTYDVAAKAFPTVPGGFRDTAAGRAAQREVLDLGARNANNFSQGLPGGLSAGVDAIEVWRDNTAGQIVSYAVRTDPDRQLVQSATDISLADANSELRNNPELLGQTIAAHERVLEALPPEVMSHESALTIQQNLDTLNTLRTALPAAQKYVSSLATIGPDYAETIADRIGEGYDTKTVNNYIRTDPSVMHAHSELQDAVRRGAPASELAQRKLNLDTAVMHSADVARGLPTGNRNWLRGAEMGDGTWQRDSAYWQTVMGVGAFGMMLLAPFERQMM